MVWGELVGQRGTRLSQLLWQLTVPKPSLLVTLFHVNNYKCTTTGGGAEPRRRCRVVAVGACDGECQRGARETALCHCAVAAFTGQCAEEVSLLNTALAWGRAFWTREGAVCRINVLLACGS